MVPIPSEELPARGDQALAFVSSSKRGGRRRDAVNVLAAPRRVGLTSQRAIGVQSAWYQSGLEPEGDEIIGERATASPFFGEGCSLPSS